MRRSTWRTDLKRKEKGQVLILALMALIILILAVFSLFDIQNLIRGKVKSQSAVDSAAIAGANWQRHTLNLVGEMNMIKATTVLIDDSLFTVGTDPDTFLKVSNRREYNVANRQKRNVLRQASNLLSQMQYRVLFLCPLIGVGAAQAAAKNNGLDGYGPFGEAVAMQNQILAGYDKRSSLYDRFKDNEYCKKYLYGFQWHIPYLNMLQILLHETGDGGTGFAVMPSGKMLGAPSLITDPPSDPDFSQMLSSRFFYSAVLGDDWCYLRSFLYSNFPAQKWWGNIKVRQNDNFPKESEYLPVRVKIAVSSEATYELVTGNKILQDVITRGGKTMTPLGEKYDWRDPSFDQEGNLVESDDTDSKLNPFPVISWAYYKDNWTDYDETTVRDWKRFLRNSFRGEASYFSGAVSRMDSYFTPKLMFTNRGANDKKLATAVKGIKRSRYVSRLSHVEDLLKSDPPAIHAYALAKPFGRLKIEKQLVPPHYSSMVLPVFSETALIPVALENPGMNPLADFHWYLFLLNYMPELGNVRFLEDVPQNLKEEFSDFHSILQKADNPMWRQFGIDWLENPIAWDEDGNVTSRQKDNCNYWPSGGSGGRSVRNVPAAKF